MSVKSERRAWYAANVESRPADVHATDAGYMEWVRRANAYMVGICEPGTSVVLPEHAAAAPAIAPVAPVASTAPVRIASMVAPSSGDRSAYSDFVEAQLRAFGEYTDAPGGYSDDLWDAGKIAARRGSGRDFAPFKGALKFALPYLNGDALDALDRGVIRWVTFAEFKQERAELRAAELLANEAERAEWEAQNAEDCTLCLAAVCECEEIAWDAA